MQAVQGEKCNSLPDILSYQYTVICAPLAVHQTSNRYFMLVHVFHDISRILDAIADKESE
jgi:hypothetical protein